MANCTRQALVLSSLVRQVSIGAVHGIGGTTNWDISGENGFNTCNNAQWASDKVHPGTWERTSEIWNAKSNTECERIRNN